MIIKMYTHFFQPKGGNSFGRTAVAICDSAHASSGRKILRKELIKEYCKKMQISEDAKAEMTRIVMPEVNRILKNTERYRILDINPKFPLVIMQ